MSSVEQDRREAVAEERATDFDAVVVGAGFSGLYMLHSLRDRLGLSTRVFEAGTDVGGTWYWNRYPGAKSDSDSYIYCYSFDEDLRQEWEWSERYPGHVEIRSYLEHVADRFDLRRDIQFSTRVVEATFDEDAKHWKIRTDKGGTVTARFFIAAVGSLSGRCRPPTRRTSRAVTPSRATLTTPRTGRTRAWTSPASGSASSERGPPRSRPYP